MNHVLKKARVWSRQLASSSIVIDLDTDSHKPNHDADPECLHGEEGPSTQNAKKKMMMMIPSTTASPRTRKSELSAIGKPFADFSLYWRSGP